MLNCKRHIEARPANRQLGSNSAPVRKAIWDNSANLVRPAIGTVRHRADRLCDAYRATVTSMRRFAIQRRADAFVSITPLAIHAISALVVTMVMHCSVRRTIANDARVQITERACNCLTNRSFVWNVRSDTLVQGVSSALTAIMAIRLASMA